MWSEAVKMSHVWAAIKEYKTTIGVIAMVVLIALSLNASHDASSEAKHAAQRADATAQQLKQIITDSAKSDYVRALQSCGSSRSLRALLDDLNIIIQGASADEPPSPALVAFSHRIHEYTDTNPNCENLPPKPPHFKGSGTK